MENIMAIKKQLDQDIKGRNNKEAAKTLIDLLQKFNALVETLEAEKDDISEVDFEALKLDIE
jgi:hypothetical protein